MNEEREDFRCQQCSKMGANWHHRKLRSQGGSDRPSNKARLCGSGTEGCHGWAHAHPEDAMRLGYIVSRDRDPASVPMYSVPWCSWVILRDDDTVKLVASPPGGDARLWVPTSEDELPVTFEAIAVGTASAVVTGKGIEVTTTFRADPPFPIDGLDICTSCGRPGYDNDADVCYACGWTSRED